MSKVLIVEDELWTAECYAKWLKAASHETRICGSSYDAITEIDDFKPDVIILDLFLPGSSGVTLLNEIKTHSDLASIAVIVCSSADVSVNLNTFGNTAYISKNKITPVKLRQMVKEMSRAAKKN